MDGTACLVADQQMKNEYVMSTVTDVGERHDVNPDHGLHATYNAFYGERQELISTALEGRVCA